MHLFYPQIIIVLCCIFLACNTVFADLDSDAETIFNWAESNFSDIVAPAATTQAEAEWRYRYYSATDIFLGVSDDDLAAAFGDLFGGLLIIGTSNDLLQAISNSVAFGEASSWTFVWNTSTETFAQSSGTSSSSDQGRFTITLGAPVTIQGQAAFPVIVAGIASYNLLIDVWSTSDESEMQVARDNLATAVLDGKIYALGGNPVGCSFSGCTK